MPHTDIPRTANERAGLKSRLQVIAILVVSGLVVALGLCQAWHWVKAGLE